MLTSARLVTWRREVPLKPCWANSSSTAPRMRSLVENWVLAIGSPEDESTACLTIARGRRRRQTPAPTTDATLHPFGPNTPQQTRLNPPTYAVFPIFTFGSHTPADPTNADN